MRYSSNHPYNFFASLWRNRELIWMSARRDVLGRYRGSILGLLWSYFNPILMLIVYTFVFVEVFNARWQNNQAKQSEFALLLFSGLIVFNLFSDCISRAPNLIVANANFVKKVVYPLEILPVVVLLSALYHAIVSLSVWSLYFFYINGNLNGSALLLPIILVPLLLFILGLSWGLASLGVFLRDLSQIISVLTSVLMFLSPIFYPVTAVPERFQYLLYLNPLSPAIEMTRDLLYWNKIPDLVSVALYWFVSLFIAWIGFVFFQKTRKGFADVL